MKKYITTSLIAVLLMVALPASAAQSIQTNAEAKAALIKELTVKLNELIKELNELIRQQDNLIRAEASNSLVSAEIYFTSNMQTGYVGACKDATARILSSSAIKKAGFAIKTTSIKCFESKNNFALSIKNSKGYSCSDSTGVMRATTLPLVTTTCPAM